MRVAELLSAADTALFPFRDGATARNASVMAAARQGTFVITTSVNRLGYEPQEHACFVRPGDVDGMRHAVRTYSGVRAAFPSLLSGDWKEIVAAHLCLYHNVLDNT